MISRSYFTVESSSIHFFLGGNMSYSRFWSGSDESDLILLVVLIMLTVFGICAVVFCIVHNKIMAKRMTEAIAIEAQVGVMACKSMGTQVKQIMKNPANDPRRTSTIFLLDSISVQDMDSRRGSIASSLA